MTITAAREALRGGETFPHPLETLGEDEIAALAIALDTGGARLHPHPAPFAGYTHLLSTTDGYRYHVRIEADEAA